KWQKRTKHSLTIVGNNQQTLINRKGKNTWLESSPWKICETLVLWRISTLVRQQLQSVFFSIQYVFIRYEKHMKVLQQWTGWSRSKSVESRSHLLLQQLSGKVIESTSSIHLIT